MRIWLALLAAPSLALACQSVLYAMVTPACGLQSRNGLHLVAAGSLALAGIFTLLAWHEWRLRAADTGGTPDSDDAGPSATRRFLAIVATAVGALSSLTILTMWMAVWVLSPCWQ
jgi:hypothetical protein